MSIIKDAVREIARMRAYTDHDANQLAQDVYELLQKLAGGDTIRIPKKSSINDLSERNKTVRQQFNGRNFKELSEKFGVCERQIRTIVNDK
jgi:Mor family transcriptional regulator